MVAFTYIAKRSDGEWKATRISAEEPELSAEASSTYDLQQTLKKLSIENSDGGSVATLFSTINEDTVIFQVNVGGAMFASGGGGGGGTAAAAAGDAAEAEEKKEEKPAEEEEEEDDDMGFSLFD